MTRIAILYDPWLLSARGTLDLEGYRDDPRGMTGSEQCAVRLFEEWRDAGHEVKLYTRSETATVDCRAMMPSIFGLPWEDRGKEEFDIAVSVNCPDGLRDVRAKVRVCYALLNDWTFCKAGFENHVDLFASPSAPHLEQVMTNPAWHRVEVTAQHLNGKAQYEPDAAKWVTVALGCDPSRYEGVTKVPGRVVYCSSPDRGLHHLLEQWPHIKRTVPHAHLRIFYRLQPWIDGFRNTPYFPPIENLRARALYIEEALRRMSDPKWGITLVDSVSRARIEREMAEAEALAYPCETTTWSEGFSVTILEACAARACPVITDCDALGGIYGAGNNSPHYGAACSITPIGGKFETSSSWQEAWRKSVIHMLKNERDRERQNQSAEQFAKGHTWALTAQRLLAAAKERL